MSKSKKKPTKESIDAKLKAIAKIAEEAGFRLKSEVTEATAGQPTLYKPEYCQMLEEHMSQGLSFEAFAGRIRVAVRTIYNWRDENPEFLQSFEIGRELGRLFWEQLGNSGASGLIPGFNAAAYRLNMFNRYRWTDRQDVTSKGDKLPPQAPATVIVNIPRNGFESGTNREEKKK